ncbi:hypothetical protein P8935_21850 [Telmatobacter sp. DSM 110680]|uniref:Secreted protein n=1 Tax=Telmatobacter sp. DSM 110680 TaxID=3036704 RepID=A0AAU7DGL8_9BACT
MRISKAVVFTTVFIVPALFCAGQTAANSAPAVPAANAPVAPFTPSAPSDILQRSLGEVQQVVGGLKLDKWKRGSVRDEAQNNAAAIQRDLEGTLPKLIKDGDTAPGTLSKVLPVSRNVDALYDVLVHLVEGARVSAPGDQVGQLQTAMADLEKARVTLDNQLQQSATVQEKQIVDLRSTVQTQAASLKAASTPPPAPKCPAPATPAKKKKTPAKTTTTTGTTAKPPAGTSASPPAKPQQ